MSTTEVKQESLDAKEGNEVLNGLVSGIKYYLYTTFSHPTMKNLLFLVSSILTISVMISCKKDNPQEEELVVSNRIFSTSIACRSYL